jgi:hypothetical protein
LEFAQTAVSESVATEVEQSTKRKSSVDDEVEDDSSQSKRLRVTSERASKRKGAESLAAMMREEADVPESKDSLDLSKFLPVTKYSRELPG